MRQNASPISLGEREQRGGHYQGKHRRRRAKAAIPARPNRCRLALRLPEKSSAGLNGTRAGINEALSHVGFAEASQ